MDPACPELVHATPGRWRYRLHSATPIDWVRLDAALRDHLSSSRWHWRANTSCSSLVLTLQPQLSWDAAEATRIGWQAVLAAMESAGATALPPPLLRVAVRVVPDRPQALRPWLKAPLNWATLAISLALLALAALLSLVGALGLLLPLLPGAPFLLLAFLLAEAAFRLRRPFVASSAA